MAATGIAALAIGLLPLGKIVPPPPPSFGPEAISEFYIANSFGIRLAGMLLLIGATFLIPLYVAISAAMLKMTPRSPVFAAIQPISGTLTILPVFYAGIFFAASSLRPERANEIIQYNSDIAWFLMIMPAPSIIPQVLVIGLAILRDKSPEPVFPRWIAYLGFWTAIILQPGVLVPLFLNGPFAWNGLLAFWIPLPVYFLWNIVMLWALLRFAKSPLADSK